MTLCFTKQKNKRCGRLKLRLRSIFLFPEWKTRSDNNESLSLSYNGDSETEYKKYSLTLLVLDYSFYSCLGIRSTERKLKKRGKSINLKSQYLRTLMIPLRSERVCSLEKMVAWGWFEGSRAVKMNNGKRKNLCIHR